MLLYFPDTGAWVDPTICAGIRVDPLVGDRAQLLVFVRNADGLSPFSVTIFESVAEAAKAARSVGNQINDFLRHGPHPLLASEADPEPTQRIH